VENRPSSSLSLAHCTALERGESKARTLNALRPALPPPPTTHHPTRHADQFAPPASCTLHAAVYRAPCILCAAIRSHLQLLCPPTATRRCAGTMMQHLEASRSSSTFSVPPHQPPNYLLIHSIYTIPTHRSLLASLVVFVAPRPSTLSPSNL
jgi:hypothetical protein